MSIWYYDYHDIKTSRISIQYFYLSVHAILNANLYFGSMELISNTYINILGEAFTFTWANERYEWTNKH